MHAQQVTASIWSATASVPPMPPLLADAHADVCVVGAGIAGLTTAYHLAGDGQRVIVLDQAPTLDANQTALTTGHLCDAVDDRYHELERIFGGRGARSAARSHRDAITTIDRICRDERIDCCFEYVDGYLVLGEAARNRGELDRECAAAMRAGFDVEIVPHAPGAWSGFGRALRFKRQAQFHATRYLAGLLRAVQARGVAVYGGTHVHALHAGTRIRVDTDLGSRVQADSVVVATNTPFNERLLMHSRQSAYRTYAIAARIDRDALPPILLWDTLDPYHYVRTARIDGQDWLIVGGEDHRVGQDRHPEQAYAKLEHWMRRWIPAAGPVGHRWSGQVYEPVDALGLFGREPGLGRNVYVATGDSGNGLTHGTLAGLTIADLIAGREAPYASLYDPARIRVDATAIGESVRDGANLTLQYADLVRPGDVPSPAALAPGEGGVVRDGLQAQAVFRDDDGTLHAHSAFCPHLGGVVRFNRAECTFDCPVHGSRFDARSGACLNGPAHRGLSDVRTAPPPSDAPDPRPSPRA